ncbi:MAG: tryptophan synthase subunit alpha [Chthoniobacterales bacterium]
MSNRIDTSFAALRQKGRKAFIAYITAGDPSLKISLQVAKTLSDAGVDLLEIGIPFSDPLADGATIQAASQRALEAGTTVPKVLDYLRSFRKHSQIPVVLFTYLNPIYAYGYEKFQQDAITAGADGILILDLPPDEAALNSELRPTQELHSIRLIAPTTPPKRIREICKTAQGFIYYVSREGVTGEQSSLAVGIGKQVAAIKQSTDLPVAVGFGISSPPQAAEVAQQADAVVVGSAIVRQIAEAAKKGSDIEKTVYDFVAPLVKATHETQ